VTAGRTAWYSAVAVMARQCGPRGGDGMVDGAVPERGGDGDNDGGD
jgi:hypothetical protein